ncbi:MAG TPA: sugar phosphate isomerase/epimerase family protein [Chloroflexota bacterium]|nr:sugar phosphate isomerase/epimerase family protein [Chloroflexota bacterium]
MKIAFSTISCPAYTAEQQARAAVEYGYDAVELYALEGQRLTVEMLAERFDEVRGAFRDANVPICSLNSWGQFSMADPDARAAMERQVICALELAAELNCSQAKTFGGALPKDLPKEHVFDYVAEHIGRIAKRGEELGVRLLLETHDGYSPSSHVQAILDRVSSPGFAALWDVHHPYRMGEVPEQVDAAIGPRVAHVHVKDCIRAAPEEDRWNFVLLGEGELAPHVQRAMELMANRGFTGYVSVDWEKQWHPEIADPEVALPHFVRVLRAYAQTGE